MIKGVCLDLSGVLYSGTEALPGALQSVERLHDAGLPVRFITNTTRKTSDAILGQLRTMQFEVSRKELFTAPIAARDYLKAHALNAYMLIHPDLQDEFGSVIPAGRIDAVLVGDAGDGFSYRNMNTAFRYLLDGARLLAMGVNRYFREADGLSLDAGPFVHALEYASGQQVVVIGKPAPEFYLTAVESLGCSAAETLMVGDDVEADVLGAVTAGLQALLVKTGKYRPGDEAQLGRRAGCVGDISAAVDFILAQQQ